MLPSPTNGRGDEGEGSEEEDFVLQLSTFEGPLDLLLHLLEVQQLDITEVSLLAVTEQYLAHLEERERLNLDALAEFIGVAARLLLMKSRALLPREPGEPEPDLEDDEEDPAALVAALQEYRRFRQAADYLRALEEEHRTAYRRTAAPPDVPLPTGLDNVSLGSLLSVFRDVLERTPEEPKLPAGLPRERVRLADRVQALAERLEREGRVSFRSLVVGAASRLAVIVEFLAVLELIKTRFLRAEQSETFGDIDLVRAEGVLPDAEEVALDFE